MMKRKKSNATRGIIALVALGFVSLVLFTLYVREGPTGPLHTIQLGAAEVLQPVRGAVGAVFQPVGDAGGRVSDAFGSSAEIERLREQVRENEELAAQASRLQQENARLTEMLNGQREAYEYGPVAGVIAPIGDQFTERITINVGSQAGIEPEQPVVIGNNTLIGRTTGRITNNTAEVMLITDQSFAAGVRIVPPADFDPATGEVIPADGEQVTYGEGLLKTSWEGTLEVDLVDLDASVNEGDFVVTSGRAGNMELLFPPGLYLGTVESVSARDIDQYKNIVVDPAVTAENLEEVRVIVDW